MKMPKGRKKECKMTYDELNEDYELNRRFLDLYLDGLDKIENLGLSKVIDFVNELMQYEKNNAYWNNENPLKGKSIGERIKYGLENGFIFEEDGKLRFKSQFNIPINSEPYKKYPKAFEYAKSKIEEGTSK